MFEWIAKILGPKDSYWEGENFLFTTTYIPVDL